tara:strand:- start:4824 stop:5738 length:915 start_codon:yes stop_codon:yes gene_type:complete
MFKFIISKQLKKYFDHKKLSLAYTHIIKSRPYYKGIKKITDVEYKAFSQNGEDGIIDYLLCTLGIEKPKFVEIGVGDYSECNTRLLYHRTASKGLIIDCLNNFEKEVKKNVKIWKGGLNIVESFINDKNILSILSEKGFIKNIDLFSLDIDGIDYWVLEKLPNNFSKIVILEYNAIFGPELEVTVPNIERFNRTKYHYSNLCFGSSLKAIINLMIKKDFIFVGTNLSSCNAFFISRDQIHKINLIIPDNINLNSHTNSFIRESRTKKGLLNYLSGKSRIKAIKDCEVINLKDDSKKILKLKNLI